MTAHSTATGDATMSRGYCCCLCGQGLRLTKEQTSKLIKCPHCRDWGKPIPKRLFTSGAQENHDGKVIGQGTQRRGRLHGKVAIIPGVGGKRGIGPATMARFVEEGARVFVCDLDAEAGEEFVRSVDGSGR